MELVSKIAGFKDDYTKSTKTTQEWLQELGVKRYYFASPGKIQSGPGVGQMREYLDLTTFHPTPASNWKCLPTDEMPMSCGYITKPGRSSFIFVALTFQQLFGFYKLVPAVSRHLNTMVLNHSPCHQFFDLDCSIRKNGEGVAVSQSVDVYQRIKDKTDDVIAEWFEYWPAFFAKEVGYREINLSVTQVEIASCEGKFSIHIHVVSEAFVNVDHHKAAVLQFVEWLTEHEPESLLLLVLDVSVYTQNRNMRLVGSCKPGKQTLAVYDYKKKQALPLNAITEEHIFNGLISYALALHPGQEPVAFEPQNAAQTRKRKQRTDGQNLLSTKIKHQRVSCPLRNKIAEAVLPYGFEIKGDMSSNGFFECVQQAEGRACFFLDDNDEPIFHQRNRARCWVNTAGVWIGCHSAKCSGKRQLLLPQESEEELIHPDPASGDEGETVEETGVQGGEREVGVQGGEREVGVQGGEREVSVQGGERAIGVRGEDEEEMEGLREDEEKEEETTKTSAHRDDDKEDEERKELGEPQSARALMQDDRPELSKMVEIHAEWERKNQANLKTAAKQSKSSNTATAKKGKDELAKLRNALYLALVQYLNKYLMAIVRGNKAIIISEIVVMNKRTMLFGYQHSIWSVNDFKQIHFNWMLPGIDTSITTIWLAHSQRRQVDNIVFRPQPDTLVDTSRFQDFNMYKGAGISRAKALDWARQNPDWQQQMEPLLHHVESIWCSDVPELIRYVMGWMAHVSRSRMRKPLPVWF